MNLTHERDALLTVMGRETLENRYLMPGEGYQDMFARVSKTYADDDLHAQRLYDYMSKHWFLPATPILSNGGAGRGLPISCFLNSVPDNLAGIKDTWVENIDLASNGGGIGTYWGGVRSIGSKVKGAGQTSGIIPFIRVMDSMTLAISQGSLRRGSAAVYLDISHPEIEEFLEIRKPSGDFNRKSLNLHHGVNIPDSFMWAVRFDEAWPLIDPKTQQTVKTVSARELWQKVLDIRVQTGEPYLIFIDNANTAMPEFQRKAGLKVRQSNLCAEIMLASGPDQFDVLRTAVCCLSSINAETYDQWADNEMFIEDVMRMLDNVLTDFINRAPEGMKNAVYSATRERSVGLGLMGFHSFLQSKMIPFESEMAKAWNVRLFTHIKAAADKASRVLAEERGACPDAADQGVMERFAHKMAVAPTASISIIAGNTSAGIEPIPANCYTHKTFSGSFVVKNRYLDALLAKYADEIEYALDCTDSPTGDWTKEGWLEEQWNSILENEGSVQQISVLTEEEKAVFRTAMEIDQMAVVEMSNDRAPYICQGQSVNLFLPGDVDKWDLHQLHWKAWEGGSKSLYYLRSKSVQRAGHAGDEVKDTPTSGFVEAPPEAETEECLSCQ